MTTPPDSAVLDSPPVARRRWLRPGVWFAIAAIAKFVVSVAGRLQVNGAVPADEFYPAEVLYGALPWLRPVAVVAGLAAGLLVVVNAIRSRPRFGPTGFLLAIAAGLLIAGAPTEGTGPWTLTATLLLFVSSLVRTVRSLDAAAAPRRAALTRLGASLSQVTLGTLASWWLVLSVLSAVAAIAITAVESVVYSARFAPELFESAALADYRLQLPGLAAHFGVITSLLFLVPPGLVLGWRRVTRASRRPATEHRMPLLVAGSISICAGVALTRVVFQLVGDEIVATGLRWETGIALLGFVMWWNHSAFSNLLALARHAPAGTAPTPSRAWATAAVSILGPPVESLPGFTREHAARGPFFLFQAALAALWLGVLAYTSYPDLDDFRARFITIFVVSAVHVSVLGLIAVAFAREPRWTGWRRLPLAAVVLLIGITWGFRPMKAGVLVLHEYARFGYVVKRHGLGEWFRPRDRLGLEPTTQRFAYHDLEGERYGDYPVSARLPPIVMILWDAARPEHMGCYGYSLDTTPVADRLAEESVVFERAYSMSTATTCGVRHLFTGCYSSRYMLSKEHRPFFVHALREHGYRRFFLTALGSDYNGVSMDSFRRGGPPEEIDGTHLINVGQHPEGGDVEAPDWHKAQGVIRQWREEFEQRGPGCLDGSFTYLHLTGAHFPWFNRDPIRDYGDRPEDLYDSELAKVDRLTGEVLDTLRELGAYEDAIVILVADHGTGLLDHGRYAGFLPYEEQIRIPLLLKATGLAPRRVSEPVGLIDLAPTLLARFEPGGENLYHGVDLWPLARGDVEQLPRSQIVQLCAFEDAYSLIEEGRWKLHYHRTEGYALLYDLAQDPLERRNLIHREPEIARRLTAALEAFLWQGIDSYGNPYFYRDWTPPQ